MVMAQGEDPAKTPLLRVKAESASGIQVKRRSLEGGDSRSWRMEAQHGAKRW